MIVTSQSRKVNGYVKAVQRRDKIARLYLEAKADVELRLGRLTGGQLAEAQLILSSL